MLGGLFSPTLTWVSRTERVKSGWYLTDVVAVIFGITTLAFFTGWFFSAAFAGTFSRGLIAGFTSLCEGAATDGFFTGSTAFSCLGAAFFGSGAAVFFTGAAFSGVFL